MTKEDKQIIDRAVKEEWRIGDRTRLKRLLEKNLKQYRENVELERKLEQAEKDIAELKEQNRNYEQLIDNGSVTLVKERLKNYKQLTKAKEHIRTLISCLIDWVQEGDKDYCYIADAEQFLKDVPET